MRIAKTSSLGLAAFSAWETYLAVSGGIPNTTSVAFDAALAVAIGLASVGMMVAVAVVEIKRSIR